MPHLKDFAKCLKSRPDVLISTPTQNLKRKIENLFQVSKAQAYEIGNPLCGSKEHHDGVVNSGRKGKTILNGNSSSCSFSPSKLGLTVSANGFIMEIKIGNITNRFSAEGWNLNSQCISLAVETILSSLINQVGQYLNVGDEKS